MALAAKAGGAAVGDAITRPQEIPARFTRETESK